jgi:hypothetical protein
MYKNWTATSGILRRAFVPPSIDTQELGGKREGRLAAFRRSKEIQADFSELGSPCGWVDRLRGGYLFVFVQSFETYQAGWKDGAEVGVPRKIRRRENAGLAGFDVLSDDWRFSIGNLVVPTARPFHLVE